MTVKIDVFHQSQPRLSFLKFLAAAETIGVILKPSFFLLLASYFSSVPQRQFCSGKLHDRGH